MSAARPGRLLGLDVGERRIGVAVSEGRIAVPLAIIDHESRAADIDRIAAMAREQEVAAVVVGLPVSMSGEEHAQAKRTRSFGDALARGLDRPVVYQDERLSTVQASRAGGRTVAPRRPRAVHPARRRGKPRVDDLAAAVILQAYLDSRERPDEGPSGRGT